MAIFFDAPLTPDALTTFVRNVPTPQNYRLTQMFPRRNLPSNRVDFAEIIRTNRTARYRSFDGRIHVSERDAGSEKFVKLIPLSSSLTMGEYERLQLEFARTGGTNKRALAQSIYNDGENLTREMQARYEQAWGDVLSDGKLTINESGLQTEADFGVPASQIVSAGAAWTTTSTAVLDDLQTWIDVYVANNGFAPGSFMTSLQVQRAMQKNTQIINAVAGSAAGRTRVTLEEIGGQLDANGLPSMDAPYDGVVDVDGTTTRTIPANKVVFFPPNRQDLGYSAWGVSATALELVNSNQSDLSFENAPGIVGVVDKSGPPYRQQTLVDATGMPILSGAKLLMVATVF